jgi:hypothetical protein
MKNRRRKKLTFNQKKDISLKKRYGLTLEEFNSIRLSQMNVCAICKKSMKLVVDHCHISGRIRGLLCSNCNTGIGLLREDTDILKSAIDYLNDDLDLIG